jgi:hypothetical protein
MKTKASIEVKVNSAIIRLPALRVGVRGKFVGRRRELSARHQQFEADL